MENIEPKAFLTYLSRNLDEETQRLMGRLKSELEILIFSGVIRDFALGYSGPMRDLDLVVKNNFHKLDEILPTFENLSARKNSFGGYKLTLGQMNIDIWDIASTWAFKEGKIHQSIFYENDLVSSCFFNFSSIVFDLNREEFIETTNFKKFRKNRVLDIVLRDNPYPELCIINTFYYREKFRLKLSKKLERYLLENFENIQKEQFAKIQVKHFNRILFTYARLTDKIAAIKAQHNKAKSMSSK